MSKAEAFALDLAREFRDAAHLNDVNKIDLNAFMALLSELPTEASDKVIFTLLDLPLDTDENNLNPVEQVRMSFFEMTYVGYLLGKEAREGKTVSENAPEAQAEAAHSPEANAMVRGWYAEAKALDPKFAEWAYGPVFSKTM